MDIYKITQYADYSTAWKHIHVSVPVKRKIKNITVPLLLTGENGIYAFLEDTKDISRIYKALLKMLDIRNRLYLFADGNDEESEAGYFYDMDSDELIEVDDVCEAFSNCYDNHLIPAADLYYYPLKKPADYLKHYDLPVELQERNDEEDRYIRPVISEYTLESVERILRGNMDEPVYDGSYRTFPNGTMEVKKSVSSSRFLGGFGGVRDFWFPCYDEDGDTDYLTMLFGGVVGLHKFRKGKIAQGILYALTGGLFGVLYCFDFLEELLGEYYDKFADYSRMSPADPIEKTVSRVYTRPVKNKKLLFLAPLCAAIAIGSTEFVYKPAYRMIGNGVSTVVSSVVENNRELIARKLGDSKYADIFSSLSEADMDILNGMTDEEVEEYLDQLISEQG